MNTATKIKLGLAVLAVVLLGIVILQNTESVETRLLFMTVTMPRAVLLFLTVLLGFALGLAAAMRSGRRDKGSD